MNSDLQQQLNESNKKIAEIRQDLDITTRIVNYHTHTGSDQTNKLPFYQVLGNIVTNTSAAYTALADDFTILCDATSAGITINLPQAVTAKYRVYNIKKIDSSGNSVTIDGFGSETIDGSTTQVTSTQYVHFTIQSNGIAWYII